MDSSVFLKALKLLFIIGLFSGLTTCKPVLSNSGHHVLEDISINQKRQSGFFSVLGVAGITGPASHPRLEIRELERNKDQWNIYLLGLRKFQGVNQNDKLSYYQISGMCKNFLMNESAS